MDFPDYIADEEGAQRRRGWPYTPDGVMLSSTEDLFKALEFIAAHDQMQSARAQSESKARTIRTKRLNRKGLLLLEKWREEVAAKRRENAEKAKQVQTDKVQARKDYEEHASLVRAQRALR